MLNGFLCNRSCAILVSQRRLHDLVKQHCTIQKWAFLLLLISGLRLGRSSLANKDDTVVRSAISWQSFVVIVDQVIKCHLHLLPPLLLYHHFRMSTLGKEASDFEVNSRNLIDNHHHEVDKDEEGEESHVVPPKFQLGFLIANGFIVLREARIGHIEEAITVGEEERGTRQHHILIEELESVHPGQSKGSTDPDVDHLQARYECQHTELEVSVVASVDNQGTQDEPSCQEERLVELGRKLLPPGLHVEGQGAVLFVPPLATQMFLTQIQEDWYEEDQGTDKDDCEDRVETAEPLIESVCRKRHRFYHAGDGDLDRRFEQGPNEGVPE